MAELPGVDLDALAGWLDAELPGARTGPLTGTVITGGKSNLTYRISDGTHRWALRRQPLGHLLPTAHDMAREFRVISALYDTDVPVPQPFALCVRPEVLGAQFYLMSFVDGAVLDQAERVRALSAAQAGRCGELLIDTLLALHAVEPASVGLAELGRPDGYLARQLARWRKQWDASQTQPRPAMERVTELLAASLPQQSAPGIVHGDYRLTNVMFRPDLSEIAAVVDWEMATLGDPLADVGLLVVYHTMAETTDMTMPLMTPRDGFLSAEQLVARYAAASPRRLDDLDWYVGFGYFKLAVVAEGIHHRYLGGQTVGEGFAEYGPAVPALLDAALDRLDAHRP